jgi:hypothetical protein
MLTLTDLNSIASSRLQATLSWFHDIYGWEADIDRFLNRYVPHPRWHLFPRPVAHFLGHREDLPPKMGNVLTSLWSCVGVFCGLSVISVVSLHIPSFRDRDVPIIVGSFVSQ